MDTLHHLRLPSVFGPICSPFMGSKVDPKLLASEYDIACIYLNLGKTAIV